MFSAGNRVKESTDGHRQWTCTSVDILGRETSRAIKQKRALQTFFSNVHERCKIDPVTFAAWTLRQRPHVVSALFLERLQGCRAGEVSSSRFVSIVSSENNESTAEKLN
jgi:hypothetical protein